MLGIENPGLENEPVDVNPGDHFLGLDLDMLMVEQSWRWLSYHAQRGMDISFVVYDLLPVRRPDCFMFQDEGALFKEWLNRLAKISTGLVAISRSVANEIRDWIDGMPDAPCRDLKLGYFHLGADIETLGVTNKLTTEDDALVKGIATDDDIILMVGTVEPRKGHRQALDAFDILWKEGSNAKLVIVGKPGWMVDELIQRLQNHPEINKRLFWMKAASDNLLLACYHLATAALICSEGEGFGLPLIEAARHGKPIITRDLPVFREVAGEHAYYFDGESGEGLARTVREWFKLHRQNHHPKPEGIPWLTWKESAHNLKNC